MADTWIKYIRRCERISPPGCKILFPLPSTTNQRGFTLVEVLVTLGLIAFIGAIGTLSLFQIFKGVNKADITNKVKNDGEFLVAFLERYLRISRNIVIDNSTPPKLLLNLTDYNGVVTTLTCDPEPADKSRNGKMTYQTSLSPTPQDLTDTDRQKGVSVVFCTFTTYALSSTDQFAPPIVSVEFLLKEGVRAPARVEFAARQGASQTCAGQTVTFGICFKTTVSTRNY